MYTLFNFNSRSIMSAFVQSGSEPMKVDGEEVCAVGVQLVTADGEQGAGINVKRNCAHLDNPLGDPLLNMCECV